MNENVLDLSDCRIFKSTISPEQNDEIPWFFCMSIQVNEN